MKRLVAALLLIAAHAAAWEPDTTHAGLTEQAALASRVHARLTVLHGARGGWLEPLTIAPERARDLYAKLATVEPTSGAVPDRRGRQSALAWLTAGAVVEGLPADRNRDHFYDPATKRGLGGADTVAAPDWIMARENDLGLPRFWLELERSATAAGPAEREEHMAMALLCAGAMLHVLEDMGVPARVRSDKDEFGLPLGGGLGDRGSRFERLAALVDGRLGVPEAQPAVARAHARDFFTSADGTGLADVTHARWFSSGTLPARTDVPARGGPSLEKVRAAQRLPVPRIERELEVGGGSVRDAGGTCLADYSVEDNWVRFFISDDCAAEQLGAILPVVGSYGAGFLDWMFRGVLTVTVQDGAVLVAAPKAETQLGAGQLTVLGEDKAGQRTVIGTAPWSSTAQVPAKPGFARYVAVFRGADSAGEAVVAVGSAAAP